MRRPLRAIHSTSGFAAHRPGYFSGPAQCRYPGGDSAGRGARRGRVLIARLDSTGNLLLAGGAVRAVAAEARSVTMLLGPEQAAAARLLPGVDEVIEYEVGWSVLDPPPISLPAVRTLLRRYAAVASTLP